MNHKSVSIELHRRSCARVEPPTSTITDEGEIQEVNPPKTVAPPPTALTTE